MDSANVTSTISTAHREVSHHVHTASFQELESGQKAPTPHNEDLNATHGNWLNINECKPAEQSVSFDDAKMRNKKVSSA